MLRTSRRAVRTALILGFLLHTLAALLVWETWGGPFSRGNALVWIDFPVVLAYLHLDGKPFLLWSLLAGGLQWGVIAALFSLWLGRTVRRGGAPRP